MLIKRSERHPRGSKLAFTPTAMPDSHVRPARLPAPLRSCGRRACGTRHLRARLDPAGEGRSAAGARRDSRDPQEYLHPLLGRLHGDRRGGERRLDRAGAGLGLSDQSRLALLQRRGGARRCAERAAPALPDEARRREMEPDLVGPGHRRDRRSAARDPRKIGTGLGATGSAPRSSPTRPPISIASSRRSGAPTTPIIRRASVTPPRSRASRTRGAMAR